MPYLREEPDIDLFNPVNFFYTFFCEHGREDIVNLSDVVDRIFSARRLHAHRTIRSDQPVAPVPASNGTVVSHLGRGARYR